MDENTSLKNVVRQIGRQAEQQKVSREIHLNSVDPVLNDRELAKLLDPTGRIVTPWRIRKWRLEGGMPYFPIGNRVFFRLSSVLAWIQTLEAGTQNAKAETGKIRKID